MGSILALLDVIELILHATQVLSFDHIVYVLGTVGASSVTEGWWLVQGIFCNAVMTLNQAWLVHVGLTELLEVVRGSRVLDVDSLSDRVVSSLFLNSISLPACWSNFGVWILSYRSWVFRVT